MKDVKAPGKAVTAAIYLGGAFVIVVMVWVSVAFMKSEGLWP